ncbi:MAG: SCP-2 sterol transfer family protein [Myxococcota bacterium]
MSQAFLSDGWFAEARKIFQEVAPPVPAAIQDLVINLRVKGGPNGDVEARMAAGQLLKGLGDGAPATLIIPYDVARKMIVENDQNAAMQAFMGGQIQIEGDMTKVMAMQAAGPPGPESLQVAKRIREMTA